MVDVVLRILKTENVNKAAESRADYSHVGPGVTPRSHMIIQRSAADVVYFFLEASLEDLDYSLLSRLSIGTILIRDIAFSSAWRIPRCSPAGHDNGPSIIMTASRASTQQAQISPGKGLGFISNSLYYTATYT